MDTAHISTDRPAAPVEHEDPMKPYLVMDLGDLPGEEWQDVVGYVGRYQVSSLGRVKSLPNSRRFVPMILKQQAYVRTGYLTVQFTTTKEGRWHQLRHWVAIVVCTAFHGPCRIGMEACHDDGEKLNNAKGNLRWDTPTANQADRERHGTANIGEQNPHSKLTVAEVTQIKKMLVYDDDLDGIARKFGVTRYAIKNIRNGFSWKHITI